MMRSAVTGRLAYLAQLKLWDVTTGEEAAQLLFQSDPVRASPLSELKHYWPELVRQAFKSSGLKLADMEQVEGVNVASLRVSLSRNNGAGIVRRRFSSGRKAYMVTLHVEREALVNVLQKLQALALAPGRRPPEMQFWKTRKGDYASIEFDSSVGVQKFPEEFTAAHPIDGYPVIATVQDMQEPKQGRTALLYALEPV